ncbi:MAG: amidase [Thermoleophilia bacterium]|nr:amidase [Thermoleophilia bacterium]
MTDQALTHMSALRLAAAIRSGETSSRAVVETHISRLREVEHALNAVVYDRYEQALADAGAADARIAASNGPDDPALPPLLGVPCTVKESFEMVGMPNCVGVVHRKDVRSTTNAPPVQRLIDAGAIPLGVTNISELTLWIESDNRVYGRANNAYDQTRAAGGSSGGEGAAIGSGGSPFGIGTDIAGSIRVPAFFNGIFGHKPTVGVVPNSGQWPHAVGSAAALLGTGPLARRAEDLMPLLRIIAGPDGSDDLVRDVELGDPASVNLSGLDVLLSRDAWYFPASHELMDARERAAGALAALGANVRDVSLKSLRRALGLLLVALVEGGGDTVAEMLTPEGGPPVTLRTALRDRRARHTWPTIWLLGGEALLAHSPSRSAKRQLAAGRALADEFNAVVGDGVLLHPPHSRVAPKHGSTVARPWAVAPTSMFNLTGSPVTQVPLGLNRGGLPLGVQVVAGRDRDHVSIAIAMALENVFGGWVPPSARA